ncbi:MAG: GntR family transcriptional regulator [Lachnospiraceae bacterium]|nr:GntR family transcriptional regulator [Lachnospiraceae bacterium]
MVIEIDFNSNEAYYMQIRNQVIRQIAYGGLEPGEGLPSVRQLAERVGINMHTVNKAYALLRDEGYLRIDRRRGAVVDIAFREGDDMDEISDDIKMAVAKARCKGVDRTLLHRLIDEDFDS